MKKEFAELKKMFFMIYTNYLTYLVKPTIFLLIFVLFFKLLTFTFESSEVLFGIFINLFLPFIVGLGISMLLEPLNKYLINKWHFPRWLAVTVTLSLSVLIAITVVSYVIYLLIIQLIKAFTSALNYFENIDYNGLYVRTTDKVNDSFLKEYLTQEKLDTYYNILMDNWQSWLSKSAEIASAVGKGSFSVVNNLATGFLPSFFLIIILAVLTSFFLSKDKDKCLKLMHDMLPNKVYENIFIVREHIIRNLFLFAKGQISLVSITGLILFVSFLIIGSPYAFLLALFCVVLDLMPIIGTAVLIVPWACYEFFTGDVVDGSILLGFYIFSLVFRQIIEPKIMGDSLGFHPLLLVMAIYIGMKLFGALGIFIGPLALIFIKILFDVGIVKVKKVNENAENAEREETLEADVPASE